MSPRRHDAPPSRAALSPHSHAHAGRILAETVQNCRNAPPQGVKGNANFLHADGDATVDPTTHALTHINGKPLEREKLYMISIYQVCEL